MLFGIYINQKAFIDLNLKISFEAAAVLVVFQQKMAISEYQKHAIQSEGKLFFWLNHGVLIESLPLIFQEYGTENAKKIKIFRLTNELVNLGLIEKYSDSQKLNKSYYAVTELATKTIDTHFKNETPPISKMKRPHFKNETPPISKMKRPHFKNETPPISKMKRPHFKNETHSIISREEEEKYKIRVEEKDALTPETEKKVSDFVASETQKNVVENCAAPTVEKLGDVVIVERDVEAELMQSLLAMFENQSDLNGIKQRCENYSVTWYDENKMGYAQKFIDNHLKDGKNTPLSKLQLKQKFNNGLDWLIPSVNEAKNRNLKNGTNNGTHNRKDGWQPRHDSARIAELVETVRFGGIDRSGNGNNGTNALDRLDALFARQESESGVETVCELSS